MPTPKLIYMSEELDAAQCKAENLEEERDSLQARVEELESDMTENTPIQCIECEVLIADNEQLSRELRLTREGNPTFSELRSQIEVQAEKLTELREAAETVCTTYEEYRDSEGDWPLYGIADESLRVLCAKLADVESAALARTESTEGKGE